MRIASTAALLLAIVAGPANADQLADAAGSYSVDSASTVGFQVANVAGSGIVGQFDRFSGRFVLNAADLGRSTVQFALYPQSVRTGEARVERFLRSDAVFDVERYPQITFRSTRVTRTGDNSARIDGTLSARGKSAAASFDAALDELGKATISFHVRGRILRSPYGMDVGTPIYSNVVVLDMELHGTRR